MSNHVRVTLGLAGGLLRYGRTNVASREENIVVRHQSAWGKNKDFN